MGGHARGEGGAGGLLVPQTERDAYLQVGRTEEAWERRKRRQERRETRAQRFLHSDAARVEALLRPLYFDHYRAGNLSDPVLFPAEARVLDAWTGRCKGVQALRRGDLAPCFPMPKIAQLETRGGWKRNVSAPHATAPLLRTPVELFPASRLPLSLFRGFLYGDGAVGGGECMEASRRRRITCPPFLCAPALLDPAGGGVAGQAGGGGVGWEGQAHEEEALQAALEREHGHGQENGGKEKNEKREKEEGKKYTREFVAAQYRLAAERRGKQNEEPLSHGACYADAAEASGMLSYADVCWRMRTST